MRPDEDARSYGAAELLDTPQEKAFDRITKLVARFLKVPVALVTILDEHRQFFKSEVGLSGPWRAKRETPLTHSFCQHVVKTEAALVIEEARVHPLVYDNMAIADLGVEAYLGVPIHAADGTTIGSLCAIDSVPRQWTVDEQQILNDLVEILETELSLREEIRLRRLAEEGRALLMREMEHRVKNSFAKVQAIVSLSMRQGRDMEEVRTSVTQRIASLARTQSLLVGAREQAAQLADILRNELGHYDEAGRLVLSGEPVLVCADDAVTIGMVVHELGTNAAKYGAISCGGTIGVAWREVGTQASRRLRLTWHENGVVVAAEPQTKGFGSTLLDVLVIRQHNGRISRQWLETGLLLEAEFDLQELG